MRIKRSTQLRKLMIAYCKQQLIELNSVKFFFDGIRLLGEQTPDELKMKDNDEIDAIVEKCKGQEESKKAMDQPAHINIKIKSQDGSEICFKINCNTKLRRLMISYCENKFLQYSSVRFLYEGRRINGNKTPNELGMEDGDEIDAMLEQMSGGF
ncbi:PREDICTED: small ubiquitin-related modifier 2-like isoform X2 [Nelumbo nucifera]|nr:PREDICTED: small ubiquitin-related modifier 2-like isoform X2 [Nelumbo nucifera]XP_010241413.1 PREDICTED: small ubiquitin-related modifier 2-like isoform X2 [Nelumbo nucifera]